MCIVGDIAKKIQQALKKARITEKLIKSGNITKAVRTHFKQS